MINVNQRYIGHIGKYRLYAELKPVGEGFYKASVFADIDANEYRKSELTPPMNIKEGYKWLFENLAQRLILDVTKINVDEDWFKEKKEE